MQNHQWYTDYVMPDYFFFGDNTLTHEGEDQHQRVFDCAMVAQSEDEFKAMVERGDDPFAAIANPKGLYLGF